MITQERLKEVAHYNPDTGIFTWKTVLSYRTVIGQPFGSKHHSGYLSVTIDGRVYRLHSLAMFYVTGQWPQEFIDHANGVRDDNRFSNLRFASRSENTRNAKIRKDNRSGTKGVNYRNKSGGQWICRIYTNEGRIYLGCFKTEEEAIQVITDAREKYHKEFAKHV